MKAHFRGPLTVGSVARHLGLSPSRLSHLFRARTGSTCGEILRQTRMERAAGLLEGTDSAIKDIAAEIGSSPEVFERAFRSWWSVSPSAYRRRKRWERMEETLDADAGDSTKCKEIAG